MKANYASAHPLCPKYHRDTHEPWLCRLCQELNRGSEAIVLLRENRDKLAEEHALNVMKEDYHLPCPVCEVLTKTRVWLEGGDEADSTGTAP